MPYLPHWPIPTTLGKRQVDYETVFERAEKVLQKLGNPHLKLPPVIHVAGTNGKGSTASLIANIFRCAGYRAHLYTSPHLHECNERILLNGEKISDSALFEIMEETRLAAESGMEEVPLTFMEGFTIGAFLAFAKTAADVVVLECGMGGRIDITNIFPQKLATVITPISFDHMEYLGNSIERIALEKAMIMRPETPLIVAPQPTKALGIIEILAQDQGIKTHLYDRDFSIELDERDGEFDFSFGEIFLNNLPKPALLGDHQYINFATALATIFAIRNKFEIDNKAIRQAVSTVRWESRLEKISGNLTKILGNAASELWIDGAHNPSGAFALARWLTTSTKENNTLKNFVICGFSRNKCKKEFLEKFINIAELVAVTVDGEPYPEEAEKIVEVGKSIGVEISAANDLLDAIHYIAKQSAGTACRVVICGSLHLARDVKKFS